ncbi:MAG TPA: alpha-ketoglutarate-dependent dioxygenase AlkB [Thermoanaerobaculia bacterium]|jgi:alkylated DNA repair dioxygenase AlkB
MTTRRSTRSSIASAAAPEGLVYVDDFLGEDEERALLAEIEAYPFHEVRMRGQVARRTVIHFGWDYDYDGWKIHPATPPSPALRALADRCAEVADVAPESLEQFLVARYPSGATIGWHRDAPMFGSPVIGISLGSPCTMKFRRALGEGFEVFSQLLAPRSLYILGGAARTQWQHSIPPTKALRYSISMRTLRRRPST